ncbi:MAG: hypothetical protein ACXVJD_12350 [Mucilaginibacter sp.]
MKDNKNDKQQYDHQQKNGFHICMVDPAPVFIEIFHNSTYDERFAHSLKDK